MQQEHLETLRDMIREAEAEAHNLERFATLAGRARVHRERAAALRALIGDRAPLNTFAIAGTLTIRPWIGYASLGTSSVHFAVAVPTLTRNDVLQVVYHTDDEAADRMVAMSPGEQARFTGRITNRFTEGVTDARVVLVAETVEPV